MRGNPNMQMANNQNQPVRIYFLSEITHLIKDALLELSGYEFWVRAYLIAPRWKQRSGHYYCELMDVDAMGDTIARIRAIIWRDNYMRITRKLQTLGMPDALKDNSEVCFLCAVRYHEVYGLSLDIYDIDPTFGESQINLNRRQILERLTKEDILNRNKETYLPVASLRIGLITSKESAAYNDFTKTIIASSFSFQIVFADCPMQGKDMEQGLISSLQHLTQAQVDVICIVRGGGSQADLAWFDNEQIARAVLACPIPIWVGIGHEIDIGVLDFIAHRSCNTPTAVAEELVERIQELVTILRTVGDQLQHIVDRRVATQEQLMQRNIHGAMMGLRKQFELASAQLDNSMLGTRSSFERVFITEEVNIEGKVQRLHDRSDWLLDTKQESFKERCERLQLSRYLQILADKEVSLNDKAKRLDAMLLERVLKRGYTITRDSRGHVLKSVTQIKEGDSVETQFTDGMATSVVTKRR
jgi:exodeoxyribonuclease VII large subunit